MSERATPETDEVAMSWYGNKDAVQGDFARQVERERDEARELARELADTLFDAHKRLNSFLNRPGGAMSLHDSMLVAKCERLLTKAKEVLP